MARNFRSRIQHVAPGSPVSASNTSRATRQLEDSRNFQREQLDAIESQQLLLYPEQSVATDVNVGQPVYWNSSTQRFELALAGVEPDPESGALVPLESSECLGVVVRKINASLADIGTLGVAHFRSLAAAIDGDIVPGRYYLSATEPGKLTRQRPAVSVPVCHVIGPQTDCDENLWMLIQPQARDFVESHVHYRFDLVCHPAGDTSPPVAGECHVITNADVTKPGWLPASHASFNGHATSGANFGYNLAAHPALSRVWPPIPLESAVILWDKGDGTLGGAREIPTRGDEPLVVIDRYGIWWMTCCYGDVPWSTLLDTAAESSDSVVVESLSSGQELCPRTDAMRLILAYAAMLFATDKSVVTSVEADTAQPISFVNCDGAAATSGALRARLDLTTTISDEEILGGVTLKSLIGPGFKFGAGYVLEGLIATDDNVLLTSTRQRYLTPGDSETPLVHQGIVSIGVNLEPGDHELSPLIVRLADVVERPFRGLLYLGFPTARDSSLRMRFDIPSSGLPTGPKFKLRTWVFGRGSDGPLPEITASYYRLLAPTDDTPTPIVEGDTTLDYDVVGPSDPLAGDSVIIVESDEFTIAAGDTVIVQLARAATASPAYDNDFGLVRAAGVIIAGG